MSIDVQDARKKLEEIGKNVEQDEEENMSEPPTYGLGKLCLAHTSDSWPLVNHCITLESLVKVMQTQDSASLLKI